MQALANSHAYYGACHRDLSDVIIAAVVLPLPFDVVSTMAPSRDFEAGRVN